MHTQEKCLNTWINILDFYLCLWRHNTAESILRRMGNNLQFFQVHCNTGEINQEKGFAQCSDTEVKLNPLNTEEDLEQVSWRPHTVTSQSKQRMTKYFSPSLFCIHCNTHTLWGFQTMTVQLSHTVLIHYCSKSAGITRSHCTQCHMLAVPWKSSLLWATLSRSALNTWQVYPAAVIVCPFRTSSVS